MKKATEVAKDLISGRCLYPKEHLLGSQKWYAAPPANQCQDCVASAIREQVKEALEEAQARVESIECAGISSYEVSARIVTAIWKLTQKVE